MGIEAVPASQATLEIDLAAVARNWNGLRGRLAEGSECGAVLKADAYGLGAAEVAQALGKAGCRRFFVAHLGMARPALHLAGVVQNGDDVLRDVALLLAIEQPVQDEDARLRRNDVAQ
ncbi:MAG: alanine racemase, partial [Alphaproteobacteria bacterium]